MAKQSCRIAGLVFLSLICAFTAPLSLNSSSVPLAKEQKDEAKTVVRALNASEETCLSQETLMRLPRNPPSFPSRHLALLCASGLSEREIVLIVRAYHSYGNAYAFRRFPGGRIPEDAIYRLAQHASIVSGGGVDPALIASILEKESRRGRFLGGCSYFPVGEDKPLNRTLAGEPEAFLKVMTGINATRHRNQHIPVSYPRVSCSGKRSYGGAMGPGQFLPSVYLSYEPEIREAMGRSHFVSPYEVTAAFHGVAMYLRDHAGSFRVLPSEVSITDAKVCGGLAAKYYAGRRWRAHDGEGEYGGRVCSFAQTVAARF